jgi:hypothetical protein
MSILIPAHRLGRRDFVRDASRLALAAALPGWLGARSLLAAPRGAPVRVRGRVVTGGRGVAGVAVSDGLSVVATDRDGGFELVSDAMRRHIFVRPPRGFALPVSPTGTLRLHRSIVADARGEASARFELERAARDETEHDAIVVADPQVQTEAEMALFAEQTIPDVARTVGGAAGRVAFGVTVGDIVSDTLSLFPAYERAVARTGIPFAQVVGNHDLDMTSPGDGGSTATFQRHFGPTYYSFDRGEVHYVVLDDVLWHGSGYIGYVDDAQLAWLAADLAHVEAGRTVVVFLHIPLRSTRVERANEPQWRTIWEVTNRAAVHALLEPYRAHLFAGHTHESEHVFDGRLHEFVVGTACGAWWTGPICWDGTPNGYAVLEARGAEVRWRYKGTGLPADEQLRVYGRGADATAPDEVVATVWDWEPGWTVVWYEGDDRRGAMARRRGLDPLSVSLHAGADRPARRSWVEPSPTAHQFYAAVAGRGTGEIRVEATDRFGRRYVASPTTAGA